MRPATNQLDTLSTVECGHLAWVYLHIWAPLSKVIYEFGKYILFTTLLGDTQAVGNWEIVNLYHGKRNTFKKNCARHFQNHIVDLAGEICMLQQVQRVLPYQFYSSNTNSLFYQA